MNHLFLFCDRGGLVIHTIMAETKKQAIDRLSKALGRRETWFRKGEIKIRNPQGRVEARFDDDGSLDEVVAESASFHLEQMHDKAWFMTVGNKQINFTSNSKIKARIEDY